MRMVKDGWLELSLTCHGVGAGHEVEGDGVGRVRGGVVQVALGDLVQTVRGGGHVLVHAVEERVAAHAHGHARARRLLRLPQLQAAAAAVAMLTAPLGVLRVACESGCTQGRVLRTDRESEGERKKDRS